MLDLNVEIISRDSSSCCDNQVLVMAVKEEEEELIGGKGRDQEDEEEEEHSAGTSESSSVVNADESPANAGDENSSSGAVGRFIFDVFKKEEDESYPSELLTRQLFPAPGGGPEEPGFGPLPAAADTPPRPQWLNLSFGSGGSGGQPGGPLLAGELRNFQPQRQQQVRKSRRGPRSRSSQYRGVTFYRRTGRWESHIWDCGKQVYLGGFDTAYAAARAYDRAAIKFRGVDADINFSISDYEQDMKQMGNLTKEEFVHILRRQSTGVSRGSSKYRGMALQKCGRWDSRVGQFLGKKPHDKVIIQYNGGEGVNNLDHGGDEHEIIMDATGEGSGGHNLDLNLGMALPSSDSKKVKVGGNYRVNYIDSEAPSLEIPTVDCSNTVSAPNKHLPSWPAMYPFLLPSSEGKAMEKRRAEAPASPNIGWQIPINGNFGGTSAGPLMPLMFTSSNAASSGFSSPSSSNSSSTHHHLHKLPAAPQNPNPQLLIKPGSNINNNNPFPFFTFRS
ncbi:hypothetical protein CRG98_036370 [Punica granatum]|uniref:AP2/ERF domain-containing protein n=1 Tax=Punica granatum TaxID=22663 RepID=A0A2I0IH16_PUNGR|nr:hypothetical protein CRG98_036370 [Punica granatum]